MSKTHMLLAAAVLWLMFAPGWADAKGGCGDLERIFPGNVTPGRSVCKVEIERRDLAVTLMGKKTPPGLRALALAANFGNAGAQTVIVGEFALLEGEIQPVIDALRSGGVNISALHNHMIGEHPSILYLHFQASGDREALARTVRNAMRSVAKGT